MFDVSTKAAMGMLDVGIGPTHVNSLLTSMNIPAVHENTLKRREREVGEHLETVAKWSCDEARKQEVALLQSLQSRNTATTIVMSQIL